MTIWNTVEAYGNATIGYSDRTVLDIRYGNNKDLGGNNVSTRLRSYYGCHYPSVYEYKSRYYLTLTRDIRKLSTNNTGDISIAELDLTR